MRSPAAPITTADNSRLSGRPAHPRSARQRAALDSFDAFVGYVTARLTEDPYLWAATLLDELVPLGFDGSYQTLTRQIRDRGLRPACTACAHVTKRPNAIIEHPPGEETQFDWVELPDAPAGWAFPTKRAYVLVGSLAHSGVWRAVISPSMDLHHLLAAMTVLVGLLGGVTMSWRFDRMSTVLKADASALTPMCAAERLQPLPPTLLPVVVTEERTATRQALIDWRGNLYSVPPELAATRVIVQQRLGATTIDIATISGVVIARHTLAEAGLGFTIRDSRHVTALETIALAAAPLADRTGRRNAFHRAPRPAAPRWC